MPKDGYLICFSKKNQTKKKTKKKKPKQKNLSTYPDLKRKQWLQAAKSWGFGEGNVC